MKEKKTNIYVYDIENQENIIKDSFKKKIKNSSE
jgi:hypothetical protein